MDKFSIILEANYFYKNDDIIIANSEPKYMPKFFKSIGFNWSYDALILSDPKLATNGYEYEVKLMVRWLTFMNYKLIRFKITNKWIKKK